jgi:hypothetical protein
MEAYRHGVAAILKHLSLPAIMCCGHKEYAKPTGRKNDPLFDMVAFRKAVDDILKGVTPKLALIPAQEVTVAAGKVARPTLRRPTTNNDEWVKMLQEELDIGVDGQFGPKTEAALREFQRSQGLVDDGIAGPNTWYALDNPVKPIQLAGTHSINTADTGQETVHTIDPDVWLGQLSAKYETGNRGPGTVSSGVGDPGGVSYGSYQMTSKPDGGTVKQFIEKEGKTWEGKFNGLTPGKSVFTITWKEIASTQEKAFQRAQHDFIKRIYFDPLVSHIKETTSLDLTTRSHALQNAVWSTAVQHGANNKIISNAIDKLKAKGQGDFSEDKFDEHLIEAIYAERGRRQADDRLVYFHSSSLDVQKGIANRLVAELADALKMLKDET